MTVRTAQHGTRKPTGHRGPKHEKGLVTIRYRETHTGLPGAKAGKTDQTTNTCAETMRESETIVIDECQCLLLWVKCSGLQTSPFFAGRK